MRSPNQTQQSSLGRVALVWAALVLALLDACSSPRPTCWGTCEKDADCGSELSCDPTIGYCVREVGNPENVEACELDAIDAWVCAEHEVQIPLDNESNDESVETQSVDVRGTPKGVSAVGNQLEGSFSEGKHQVSWGNGPGRHLLTIHATTECPELVASSQPQECSGRALDATLEATGGKGEVTWSLVGDDKGFTLDEHGEIRGTVTGNETITVAMADERNVRVETSVEISALAGCPSIQTTSLPAGCVESVFEWQLDVSGPNVEFRAPTVIFSDDPARDLDKLRLEINSPDDQVYRLRATPTSDAAGKYTVGLVADNENALAQAALPFEVKSCSKDSRVVCCDEEVTVNLEPGEWSLTSPGNNPLRTNVAILGDQLSFKRNGLGNGSYTLNLNNPSGDSESLLLLLSSPGAEGCEHADGGLGTSDEPTTEGDSGVSAPQLASDVPEGCVGEVYAFDMPLEGVMAGTWSLHPRSELPEGVTLDINTGTLRGRPSRAFDEPVTVTGVANGHDVQVTRQIVVHEECRLAFLGLAKGSPAKRLFSVDYRAPNPVVELSAALTNSLDEVNVFATTPGRHYLAYGTQSVEGEQTAQLFVVSAGANVEDPDLRLTTGKLELPEEITTVKELRWSATGKLGVVAAETNGDAGLSDWLITFDLTADVPSETATTHPIVDGHGLTWMDDTPCLVKVSDQSPEGPTSTCWDLQNGTALSSRPHYHTVDLLQARVFDGVWLLIQPVDEYANLFTWVPFGDDTGTVIHQAEFASPTGDLVATARGDRLEIARATDPTSYAPGEGDDRYVPLMELPDCDRVDAWAANGLLACSKEDAPNVTVGVAATDSTSEAIATFSDESHDQSGQRIFLGRDYYVFSDIAGGIRSVALTTEEATVTTTAIGASGPVALFPLDDSSFLAQTSSNIVRGTFSQAGALSLTPLDAAQPNSAGSCEGWFGARGFDRWCGGDLAPRRFQVAAGSQFGTFLTETGNLKLFDLKKSTMATVDDFEVTCSGENEPACTDQFASTR